MQQRIRSKSTSQASTAAHAADNSPIPHYAPTENVRFMSLYPGTSVITDDPTYSARFQAKPCSHRKDALGVIPGNLVILDSYLYHGAGINPYSSYTDFWWLGSSSFGGRIPMDYFPDPAASVDWNSLVTRCVDQLDGRLRSNATAGIFLAEMSQTVRMIKNPMGLLKRSPRYASRRGKTLRAAAADRWFEAHFGWLQLHRDVKAFCTAYVKYKHALPLSLRRGDRDRSLTSREWYRPAMPEPITFNCRTRQSWPLSAVDPSKFTSWSSDPWVVFSPSKFEVRATVSAYGLHFNPRMVSRIDDFCDSFGIGPRDLLPTLWDWLPLSFVADWFISTERTMQLPSVLAARKRLAQLPVGSLCYTTKGVTEVDATFFPGGYNVGWGQGIPFKDRSGTDQVLVPSWLRAPLYSPVTSRIHPASISSTHPCRRESFVRSVGLPPFTSLEYDGRVTSKRLAHGLFLIAQRF